MDPLTVNYLTLRQKARLALSVLIIYWPIRQYVNIRQLGWVTHNLTFLGIELLLTFLFFWGWVSLIDWLQGRLLRRMGDEPSNIQRLPVQLASLVVATALALVFNAGFGLLHHYTASGFEHQFPKQPHSVQDGPRDMRGPHGGRGRGGDNPQRTNNGLVVMAMLSAFYLTANRRSGLRIQTLQLQAAQLQKEAVQAQFDALKNQVSPHFLFNSLSILSSLVEVDTKLSVQFINRLSKAYRYILEQRDNEQVPLQTELDFIESYTFLLKIRFDDRLQVRIDVPEADRSKFYVAPLTLQLLVENAVKHNQMSDEIPLIVNITLEGDTLRVSNPIHIRPETGDSTGMGLQHISNRYRLLTNRPVWVGEQDGNFVIIIPLLSK